MFTPVLLAGDGHFAEIEGEMAYADFGYATTRYIERERRLETTAGEFTFHAQMWAWDADSAREVGYRPVVFVWASNRDNTTHRATLTTDGHAWVDPGPVSVTVAYDK